MKHLLRIVFLLLGATPFIVGAAAGAVSCGAVAGWSFIIEQLADLYD